MVRYEEPEPGVARIVLGRPERRNAQDPTLLYALDDALAQAVRDDAVRVIVLAADGPDFSSGHDLGASWSQEGDARTVVGRFGHDTVGEHVSMEDEMFVGLALRWRDAPKPTIAQVQGRVIAGGLMLVWPCDLVVASEDASFVDPTSAFGLNGHEYFTHLWELGHRRAKEMLFTGEAIGAQDARALGMVNRVVAREDLEEATLALARRIASRPTLGARLAKRAINNALDLQGQRQAIESALGWHHVGHAAARVEHGAIVDPAGADVIRRDARNDNGREVIS